MSAVNIEELSKEHLIQQTVATLSPELQAEYYRILRYLRSLPQDDEMLLVLNTIQILFSLTIDVPNQMAVEGEKMERLLQPAVEAQKSAVEAFGKYQRELEVRIAGVPEAIAKAINPDAIAAKITERLRQRFEDTTIPQTADLLVSELVAFKQTANGINDRHYSAAAEARRATQELRSEAAGLARHHWLWAYRLAGLALLIGMVLGGLLFWWAFFPVQSQPPAVIPQVECPQPPAPPPKAKVSSRR